MTHKNELSVEDFVAALGAIVKRIRKDSPTEIQDLSWTQKAVLKHLESGAMTSAELARLEGVTPQSMGTAINLLVERELVERKSHPTDGRQMNNKLTAQGAALRKRVRQAKETWIAQTFAKFDKQEQATLFKATELMKRMVEEK